MTLLSITLLLILVQWLTDLAHLRALWYYHICTFFSFPCKALFSDSFSIYIFFISIGLLFEPGLHYCFDLSYGSSLWASSILRATVPFSPSSVHSASPPPIQATCLYIFIYSEQFLFLGVHIGSVQYTASFVLPYSLLPT